MSLWEIYNLVDRFAPFSLSGEACEKYGYYDNSGILLDCKEEITGILFSLDLSSAAVERAKEGGANCIVTHHPAIYSPLRALKAGGGECVLACAKAGISVISAHLNLDFAKEGIDESLMLGLGGKKAREVMHALSKGGYGRIYDVSPCTMAEFAQRAKEELGAERIAVYGDRPVLKVASFCGAGLDEESLRFAQTAGADTIVSSDGKHHVLFAAAEAGLNVLLLTHYASENYGFFRFYEKIKQKVCLPCEYFADERLK